MVTVKGNGKKRPNRALPNPRGREKKEGPIST
jgi:hypothetical protein